jgi:hypothetical protein
MVFWIMPYRAFSFSASRFAIQDERESEDEDEVLE